MTGKHRRRLNNIRYARQHHCAMRDVRALQAVDRFRRKVRYDGEGRWVLRSSVTLPSNVTLVLRDGLTLTHAGNLILGAGEIPSLEATGMLMWQGSVRWDGPPLVPAVLREE